MVKDGNKFWDICYTPTDKMIKSMIELDKSVYQGQDVGTFKQCKQWLSVNRDIYTILLCDNEVVGYINFMPLTDACYNKFLSGKYKDYELTTDDVLPFKVGNNKCLFTSIVIHKKYQNTLAVARLWQGFRSKIKTLKQNGIMVSSVVFDCVTDIGEAFANNYINAKYICDSHNGKIYEGTIR